MKQPKELQMGSFSPLASLPRWSANQSGHWISSRMLITTVFEKIVMWLRFLLFSIVMGDNKTINNHPIRS